MVSKADRITSKNATLPVLACVLLEAKGSKLHIKATNLDLGLEASVPVKVEREGVVAVPGGLFVQFLSNVSDHETITLEVQNQNLTITSSHNETTIKALSHEDFPTIPQLENVHTCKISAPMLIHGLKSVWYSASVSSMKPELSSVYLYPKDGNLMFVATDSFRLAEKRIEAREVDQFESVLIPHRNVAEIIRVFDDVQADIEVRFESGQVAFVHDGVYLMTRIVDGNFPDYQQIIPKDNTTEVTVLKQDLVQALKLSNLFSDSFNQVTVSIRPDDGVFELTSKNVDKGENRNVVDATLRGEAVEISFNHKYVSDAFGSINSDSIVLMFNGRTKPVVIRGVNDPTFLYLVMPLNK
ncbi:MAG: hypothetical protein RL150_579 [Candidatus Parcubacteria bacterium]